MRLAGLILSIVTLHILAATTYIELNIPNMPLTQAATASARHHKTRLIAFFTVAIVLTLPLHSQGTTWTPFFLINGRFYSGVGEETTAAGAGYSSYSTSWPILGSALPGTVPLPPPWTGAITSAPTNLGTLQSTAMDAAGNTYGLYTTTGGFSNYLNYISQTTSANITTYFGIGPTAALVSQLAVTPSGTVFFQYSGSAGVYVLNSDGTTTLAVAPIGAPPYPPGFSVDNNGDVTFQGINFFIGANWGAGSPTLTEVFAATGPVPYFPEAITMPSANGTGYANGVFPTVPYPPQTPTYSVPFSPNPIVSMSIEPATSTLPVTYQWAYNGNPISGATLTNYNGPYLGNGIYSITASTTGGTVTASATLTTTIANTPATAVPTFISAPASTVIALGETATLSAAAEAILPVSFQWYFNGVAIPGATAITASLSDDGYYSTTYVASQPGTYTVAATTEGNDGGSTTSPSATLTVTADGDPNVGPLPTITSDPESISFDYGSIPTLEVSAVATLPTTYQWQLDGVNIAGANQSTYSSGIPGTYTVTVSTTAGATTSPPAIVALANRPINISSRALVGTGGNICIAGFVVSSYSGAKKQLLIRAVGPTLSQFNVPGTLSLPILSVYDGSGQLVASNSGWNNSPTIAAAASAVGAFALPANSADAALLLDLVPGNYTAQVSGANGTTGVALVEVYEIAADSGHLINLSTRATVGNSANILIGGFVIGGTQPSQLLIRAVGPGLSAFGVSDAMPTPVLSVYNSSGDLIAINSGWSNGSSADAVAVANAALACGAFALAPGSGDSAVYVSLVPGQYTAQVTGIDGATGVALVEVYQVP